MKRILLLSFALLAGATAIQAQGQSDQPKPKSENPPLTAEQRAQAEQKLNDEWSALSIESKMHLMRLHHALSQMPPDERKFVHDRIERFLNMSPEERDRLSQLRKKWEQMTPEERQKAREEFRKRRQNFEEKWRQEHPGQEPPPFPHNPGGPPSKDQAAPPPPPPPSPAPPPAGP
jgi:hypothetical protein